MANEQNLKPFKKGESGNPGGRPKWKQITEMLRNPKYQDKLEQITDLVYEMALKGDFKAINFIADRLEGKPSQRFEVSPKNDEPIKVFEFINTNGEAYDPLGIEEDLDKS